VDRAALQAFAQTLPLDGLELPEGGTLRRGVLTLARDSAPSEEGAPRPPSLPLPQLSVARSTAPPSAGPDGGAEIVLRSPLGQGGMGVVWVARQSSLDRDVAVKRLREDASSSVTARALVAEARITGALEHPNIIPVHVLALDDTGAPMLVMKRVEGTSLADLVADETHPAWSELERRHGDRLAAKIEVLGEIADALHFAHSRGVIHRDIKPENVMVGGFGEVYLLDWGLGLRVGALSAEEKAYVSIVGTPGFMAPEMVAGEAQWMDARTDVYLLGATLHALLTGRSRHEGATLRAVIVAAVASLPYEYDASVPSELAALANEATSGEPDERPPTAARFRERLTDYLRHRGSLRLAEEARIKLEELEGSLLARESESGRVSQDPDAAAALVEARFAFTQALRDWPGNALARDGVRRCLLLLVESEIRRRSPDAAAELARQIDPPEPSLQGRIAALREAVAESRRFEDAARREVRETDRRVGARLGVFIQTGLMVAMGAVAAIGGWSEWTSGGTSLGPQWIFGWSLGLLVLTTVTLAAFRSQTLANRWGRQMSALLLAAIATCAATSGIVALRGGTGSEAAAQMMTALAGVMGGGAIALDTRLGWTGLACLLAGLSCALWPWSTPLALGMAGIVGVGVFLPQSVRDAREQREAGGS